MNTSFLKLLNFSNFSNIIKGTNKTLSFVKQAIPIYNSSKPIINNLRNNFNKSNDKTILKKENYKSKRNNNNLNRNYNMNSITFFQ